MGTPCGDTKVAGWEDVLLVEAKPDTTKLNGHRYIITMRDMAMTPTFRIGIIGTVLKCYNKANSI